MSYRDELIDEAETYARDGASLPLDLIAALMERGIDHTEFNQANRDIIEDEVVPEFNPTDYEPEEGDGEHNVD